MVIFFYKDVTEKEQEQSVGFYIPSLEYVLKQRNVILTAGRWNKGTCEKLREECR